MTDTISGGAAAEAQCQRTTVIQALAAGILWCRKRGPPTWEMQERFAKLGKNICTMPLWCVFFFAGREIRPAALHQSDGARRVRGEHGGGQNLREAFFPASDLPPMSFSAFPAAGFLRFFF